MGRDTERYAYFYVGIPRDSETLQKLLQDVDETGLAAPKLLAVRIADFYKQTNTAIPTRTPPAPSIEEPLVREMDQDIAALNASAALDEWG